MTNEDIVFLKSCISKIFIPGTGLAGKIMEFKCSVIVDDGTQIKMMVTDNNFERYKKSAKLTHVHTKDNTGRMSVCHYTFETFKTEFEKQHTKPNYIKSTMAEIMFKPK